MYKKYSLVTISSILATFFSGHAAEKSIFSQEWYEKQFFHVLPALIEKSVVTMIGCAKEKLSQVSAIKCIIILISPFLTYAKTLF